MHGRLVLALSLLVCVAVPAPAAAAGWTKYSVETAGFAIAAPASWVDVTSATTQAMLSSLAKNPALKAAVKLASEADEIRLIVADPTASGRAYLTAGVQRVGTVKPATLVAATAKDLDQIAHVKGKVAITTVALPAGKAYLLQFAVEQPNGEVGTLEYMLVRDQVEYVFAFAAPMASWAKYAPLFAESARSFAFLAGPDLADVVLSGAQVGPGYKLASFAGGNSVIGEPTLDLCDGTYPSELLRTGRLQVRYTHPGKAIAVSNEVVTYLPGDAQQALSEVTGVARSCARKPVVRKGGGITTTFSVKPLTVPHPLAGALAVQIDEKATEGKKHYEETGVAVYQVKGNTLSGVYTFVTKGTTLAEAERLAFHAAEESAQNLDSSSLSA